MKQAIVLLVFCILSIYAQNVAYFQQLIPMPAGAGVNQAGYTYLKQQTMKDLFGNPCALTPNCVSVTNADLVKRIQRKTITKFTFSGADIALDAVGRALLKVQAGNPALYAALGNSGMLCCRAIRGSSTSFSNHAWGFAVDINIGGVLDPRGDAKVQRGLALLWPYMKEQGFYWAAGYTGASEDAMHFEIANELMLNYAQQGDWGTCTSTTGVAGRCINVNECPTSSVVGRCPGPAGIRCCLSPPAKKFTCLRAATPLRATACNTAFSLLPIPQGEQLELIGDNAVAGCGDSWRKVRARNAWTGFVPVSTVGVCNIPVGRDYYVDPNYNGTLEFPDAFGGEDAIPDDGEIGQDEDIGFEQNDARKLFSVVSMIIVAFFFAL